MTGLSARGERFAKAGTVRPQLTEIWENVYHVENNPSGTINLGTAENFVMLDDVAAFVNDKVQFEGRDLDYGAGPWGSSRLRGGMAKHMNKYFKPLQPVDPNHLVFSTGCTSICDMLGFSLFEPGQGLLLSRPIYQAFKTDFGLKAEVNCIFVSFDDQDQFSVDAVKRYEAAIEKSTAEGVEVRGIILCNPHNPLGQCYEPAAMVAYMELCQKHHIHLIIDEIYALSTYDLPGDQSTHDSIVAFRSILSFEIEKYIDLNYIHMLYGFSKDLASGGLRLGCIWTHNEALNQAVSSLTTFSWSSNLCERIGVAMLEDEQWMSQFVQTSRQKIGESSALARAVLDEHGISYVTRARAGFFLWIDVRKRLAQSHGEVTWDQHNEFKNKMREYKVYITSGESLSAERPGFFRLCFVKSEAEVRLGLDRVALALESVSKIG